MFKNNQKGVIDPVFIIVLVLVLTIGVFIYWRIGGSSNTGKEPTNGMTINSDSASANIEVEENNSTAEENSNTDTVSDDITICSVNTSAASGAGPKIAFYAHANNVEYTKSWVEYGLTSSDLNKKTQEFDNENIDGSCTDPITYLATMPASDVTSGKYFYRIALETSNGEVIYSKTDTFTK